MFLSALLSLMLVQVPDTAGITVSGGLESNNAFYVADRATNSPAEPRLGSNNYLKLTVTATHFEAGIQGEYYPEPLRGYDSDLKGLAIPMAYVGYMGERFEFTAGNFYEQYGSGLLLRSWEDRQLGINNSLAGIRSSWTTKDDVFGISAFAAHPKDALWPSKTALAGVNGELNLSSLFLSWRPRVSMEGSATGRFSDTGGEFMEMLASLNGFTIPTFVPAYSLRASFSDGGFYFRFEQVGKGGDFHVDKRYRKVDGYSLRSGNAQLLETGWNGHNLTSSLTLRRLSNMEQRIYRSDIAATLGNTINYIPALCQRQTYMLASLNPYVPIADGEIGGQADISYRFARNSTIGGRYGMIIHIGGCMFYATPEALSNWDTARLAYRDINIELEKRFSRRFNATLFVSVQESSPTNGERYATVAQNVFVMEGLYKFTKNLSLRFELQYLFSKETERDWMAVLSELNFTPHWSIYASDMYNHGSSRIHYYDFGASFTYKAFRLTAGYGRHREGMICSGGVCRYQPAFTGGSLHLTYSF